MTYFERAFMASYNKIETVLNTFSELQDVWDSILMSVIQGHVGGLERKVFCSLPLFIVLVSSRKKEKERKPLESMLLRPKVG